MRHSTRRKRIPMRTLSSSRRRQTTTRRRTISTRPASRPQSPRCVSTLRMRGSSSSRRFQSATHSSYAILCMTTTSSSPLNFSARGTRCPTISTRRASWWVLRKTTRHPSRRHTNSWTCWRMAPTRRKRPAPTPMAASAFRSLWSAPPKRRPSSCSPTPTWRFAWRISTNWTPMPRAAV